MQPLLLDSYSTIHSFNTHVLSIYCMPCMLEALGTQWDPVLKSLSSGSSGLYYIQYLISKQPHKVDYCCPHLSS